MARINKQVLIPYLTDYKKYLDGQKHNENTHVMRNENEDYKREIAAKAAKALALDRWREFEIGTGAIVSRAVKAVNQNVNLIGKFQVSTFSHKAVDYTAQSEKILFDLYHERKDEECFELLCDIFGRKYDLIAYLYFILDSDSYLPIRSNIFDRVFRKLNINLQLAGRCSWVNYQEFLNTVAEVRDTMQDYYKNSRIDLLDAHSFLWTLHSEFENLENERDIGEQDKVKEKNTEVGNLVYHKKYAEGTITRVTEDKIYVSFRDGQRIFQYPNAFEKGFLSASEPNTSTEIV